MKFELEDFASIFNLRHTVNLFTVYFSQGVPKSLEINSSE